MIKEITLDVSQLEPCEPLQRVLEALTQLSQGEYLHVLHRMEPYPLYPILNQQGYAWQTQSGQQTPIEIFIWQAQDKETEQVIKKVVSS